MGPPDRSDGPLHSSGDLSARLLARRNRNPHRFAAAAGEAGEHRINEARDYDVQTVGLRTRLGAAVEQGRVGRRLANVEVDLAVIFDIAVDAAAIPEGVIPAPRIGAAPAEPIPRTIEPPRRPVEATEAVATVAVTAVKWIADVTHLAAVDAVTELHDHVRALSVGGRRIATRLQLLGDNSRIALELEAAVVGEAAGRHDVERLSLRRRHRLVARNRRVERFGAGRQCKRGRTDCDSRRKFPDTHKTPFRTGVRVETSLSATFI